MIGKTSTLGLMAAACFALAAPSAAIAQQQPNPERVVLLTNSLGASLVGELESFDGEVYVVNAFGSVSRIPAAGVRCEGVGCPPAPIEQPRLVNGAQFGVHGSNTIGAALMPGLIESYADSLGGELEVVTGASVEESRLIATSSGGEQMFEVDLQSHGSGTSAKGLAAGLASIGMSSRPIKDSEADKLAAIGYDKMRDVGYEHIVALDGLVVIVHPDSPFNALTMQQIADIFSGDITDWSQLGGAPGAITVHARDDKSGTYDTFKSLVLKPAGVKISTPNRYESNADLSDAVAADPNAIGFTGFAYIRSAKALSIGSECGIVSAPEVFNVKTEEYPLARRLFLYTTSAQRMMDGHPRGLLDYAKSDDAQGVITDVGFINQDIDTLPFASQAVRLATAFDANPEDFSLSLLQTAMNDLRQAERLSTTMRFRSGSSTLDNKARDDLGRIARRLKAPDFASKNIIVAGYADARGPFELNGQLALQRAEAVRDELVAVAPDLVNRITVRSYSELFPVACNTSSNGQAKNRRVEFWVQ